ncbi:phage tail protein [uncultured Veillonella sp.]|uniref:phage tail-collar fiber domain-containing protein n=1 Tax=uncultured Veillonella sp. TaxID=159268 RepID=UPI0028D3BD43|nr:phage tail protein [uncultured Veillonella sp.]
MAEWSNATMTDVGAALQAKVNAGKTKLTFTKIKVGSGVNATNPLALTDVISSKWETTNFVVKLEGKIVSVDTVITNTGVHEAFRMSEIGLFAQDPDKGEILYAYLTDPEPDRMPAESGSVVVSQELTIGMVFSNTGNVSLTVNMGALVTREQLTEAVKQHNTDISSHPAITAMIAKILGATNWQENPVATLKDIKNLLGQGAIVASKLDANAGFVKFANGFTIQWGISWFDANKYYKDISLPISVTVLIALATDDSVSVATSGAECFITWNSGFSQTNRTTIRFLTNRADTGSFVWAVVGKA